MHQPVLKTTLNVPLQKCVTHRWLVVFVAPLEQLSVHPIFTPGTIISTCYLLPLYNYQYMLFAPLVQLSVNAIGTLVQLEVNSVCTLVEL